MWVHEKISGWHSRRNIPGRICLGLSTAGVKTLVFRMRKRFATFLRNEVAKTVLDPADIDPEIHALYEALVATEGRLER